MGVANERLVGLAVRRVNLVPQGYDLRVSPRLGRDGWAQRRGLSLNTPPAARVARGAALGGFWVSARRRPLRARGRLGARLSCGSTYAAVRATGVFYVFGGPFPVPRRYGSPTRPTAFW